MSPHTRGFTLIEVLVALAVIAVGAAAVLSSLDTAARAVDRVRERTFAGWIAMNRVVETRLLRATNLKESRADGDIELAGRRWHWEEKVSPTTFTGLWRIEVRVRAAESPDWLAERQGALGESLAPAGSGRDPWDINAVNP